MVEPFPGPPAPSLQLPGVGSHLLHVASKMQHVGESFLLPRFLLSLLPCLLFLFASSFFLPGSEVGQERTDGDLTDWLACNTQLVLPCAPRLGLCYPRPAQAPHPRRKTHSHAGLALLLPLAANPLLLCPLRSPLFLQKERTLAWTPWGICILSVSRDTSLTPKALRAPRADLLLPRLPREHVDQ